MALTRWNIAVSCLSAVSVSLTVACPAYGDESRAFSVRDAIEMVSFVDPVPGPQRSLPRGDFKYSPDLKRVTFVTQRSVLATDEFETTLWVMDVEALSRYVRGDGDNPAPRAIVTVRGVATPASEDGPLITDVRWTTPHSLAFLGRDARGYRRISVADLNNGSVEALTSDRQDVSAFDFSNDRFVYTSDFTWIGAEGGSDHEKPLAQPSVLVGTGVDFYELAFPDNSWGRFQHRASELWVLRDAHATPVRTATGDPLKLQSGLYEQIVAVDPTGSQAVVLANRSSIPDEWESYQPMANALPNGARIKAGAADMRVQAQYALVDLSSGAVQTLVDAPTGWTALYTMPLAAMWSADGGSVLLANTFLPLVGVDSAERKRRAAVPCVAVVKLSTRAVSCVSPIKSPDWMSAPSTIAGDFYQTQAASWLKNHTVRIDYLSIAGADDPGFNKASEVYRQRDDPPGDAGPWFPLTTGLRQRPEPPVELVIKEDLNKPPALYARDPRNYVEKLVFDPNANLKAVKMGRATVFRWTDSSGRLWEGGLMPPIDARPGARYPLVIQTHGFSRDRFLSVGLSAAASAARPLAGRGIAVLQVPDSYSDLLTDREVSAHLDGYSAAIGALERQGLVDSSRVGLQGWSRTGFYVLQALETEPKRYAAAVIADGTNFGYVQYLQSADQDADGFPAQFSKFMGAAPFGEGLRRWIDRSPGFITDRIQAPLRIEAYGRASLASNWEPYAALRMQHKPVDLLVFPNAPHEPLKPQERLGSEEGTTDWFDFWLNGHEDPDTTKGDQYRRWHQLREMRRAE